MNLNTTTEAGLNVSGLSAAFRNAGAGDIAMALAGIDLDALGILDTAFSNAQATLDDDTEVGNDGFNPTTKAFEELASLQDTVTAWCSSVRTDFTVAYSPQPATGTVAPREGRDFIIPQRLVNPGTPDESAARNLLLRNRREVALFNSLEVTRPAKTTRLLVNGVSRSPEGYNSSAYRPWLSMRLTLQPVEMRVTGIITWAGGVSSVAPVFTPGGKIACCSSRRRCSSTNGCGCSARGGTSSTTCASVWTTTTGSRDVRSSGPCTAPK
jgi:hypothetical protein